MDGSVAFLSLYLDIRDQAMNVSPDVDILGTDGMLFFYCVCIFVIFVTVFEAHCLALDVYTKFAKSYSYRDAIVELHPWF